MTHNKQSVKGLIYRGSDATMVGNFEPAWGNPEEQKKLTYNERRVAISTAINWYHATQDNKIATEFMAKWLETSEKRKVIADIVRKQGIPDVTMGWLCRAASYGLILKFSERKQIFNVIKLITKSTKIKNLDDIAEKQQKRKETIQDRISDKIRECNAKIVSDHDEFLSSGCISNDPKLISYLTDLSIPSTRIKEVSRSMVRLLEEINHVISHTDAELEEGYSNYSRKQIKSQAAWLNTAIEQINSYGAVKSLNRKPKVNKQVSPAKVIKSLKYLKTFTELNLTSIDPVNILKSSEIWVYDTKKRKIGIYVVDSATSSLSVKGSKIVGFNIITSIAKTLRKPEKQLAEMMKYGKPATKKWFDEIRSTKASLSGRITVDHLILKVYK